MSDIKTQNRLVKDDTKERNWWFWMLIQRNGLAYGKTLYDSASIELLKRSSK